MALRLRSGALLGTVAVLVFSGAIGARQAPQRPGRPDFDIRAGRARVPPSARALAELSVPPRAAPAGSARATRAHPYTGGIRVLDAPEWSSFPGAAPEDLRRLLQQAPERLGLDDDDVEGLVLARDYVSQSTGLRHVSFVQTLDGLPVFGGAITLHIAATGEVVRVTSSAARGSGREREAVFPAEAAAISAAADVSPETPFVAARIGGPSRTHVRFARGRFRRDVTASLEWFAMEGGARLAWHVELEPEVGPHFYDTLVDAQTGQLLLRRNRVLDADGTGRVVQANETHALDPRRPDQMPAGAASCPPAINHELRDLTAPFRDAPSVLANAGRLSGNNVHVYRGALGNDGAPGAFDGTRWLFDYPFNTAASAETALFFALNFAHDFFYDLGFDEAAGNFQVTNFGRGGIGGDPVQALARAPGRNNATYQHAPDGSSPIISMFLFDGIGCWSEDVDGDGTLDLDGDYDTDVVLHEFHHGVSLRLNTTFTGAEAGAMGEGGSDYFAYTVNGDTTLAEYSRPGGLRGVNSKTYADWTCLLVIFCEVHDNGEIWANALWDVRERFRTDLVHGSEATAINEANQLYIDALKLSPPSPTMLDMRDALLLADSVRNPGSPRSQNFCAIWESFAGRGMGLLATDTADNGLNQVGADFSVPDGCIAPPAPAIVTIVASQPAASESGPTNGAYLVTRNQAAATALVVNLAVGGTANAGSDYVSLPAAVTIPADDTSVVVSVLPIDDLFVEGSETVVLRISSGSGYVPGVPSSATVTIASDDVAGDLSIAALTVPAKGGAGLTISVDDTTRNQGTVTVTPSTTSFYLSTNSIFDPSDELLGSRSVPELGSGASHSASTLLTIPADTTGGSYRIIARADGPGVIFEASESNNVRSAAIGIGPDLEVAVLTAPASVGAGVPFTVSDTTINDGAGPSGASITRFYLSAGVGLDANDTELQSHPVDALDPGESQLVATALALPAGTVGGLYYLYAVTDAGNSVVEASETNNTRYRTIRVGADLRVTALEAPPRAAVGSTLTLTDTTSNVGLSGAGASRTAFYLSANTLLDANDFRLNGWRAVEPLEPGTFTSGSTTLALPQEAGAGAWFLLAKADDLDAVGEANETNNLKYSAISLGPDLTVSSSSVPRTVVAGATVTVTETILNSGLDGAASSTTRFYLSLNTVLDADDIQLGPERIVPALGPNTSSTGSTPLPLPADLSGRYYLIIVADAINVVLESKETNNTRVSVMTINP